MFDKDFFEEFVLLVIFFFSSQVLPISKLFYSSIILQTLLVISLPSQKLTFQIKFFPSSHQNTQNFSTQPNKPSKPITEKRRFVKCAVANANLIVRVEIEGKSEQK
jgi:hypothetical protein